MQEFCIKSSIENCFAIIKFQCSLSPAELKVCRQVIADSIIGCPVDHSRKWTIILEQNDAENNICGINFSELMPQENKEKGFWEYYAFA